MKFCKKLLWICQLLDMILINGIHMTLIVKYVVTLPHLANTSCKLFFFFELLRVSIVSLYKYGLALLSMHICFSF